MIKALRSVNIEAQVGNRDQIHVDCVHIILTTFATCTVITVQLTGYSIVFL